MVSCCKAVPLCVVESCCSRAIFGFCIPIPTTIPSQVTAPQVHLIDTLGIAALDMEAAPEAEIAMQVSAPCTGMQGPGMDFHPKRI